MDLRFANATPDFVAADAAKFPASGPLSVTWSHYAQAFGTWTIKGLEKIGMPVIPGFLGGSLIGSLYVTFTLDAEKILFDSNKMATGVLETAAGGYPFTLTANKEAILSAGNFGSPQLLMVSSVGTAEELSALGIDVIAGRPSIGNGMQDHDIISHRSKDSPPAPILGYPRVEDNSSDYETFTGQQLDSFVNAACKYFIENGNLQADPLGTHINLVDFYIRVEKESLVSTLHLMPTLLSLSSLSVV